MSAGKAARVVEVFSSLQGEGARLGERQIFVRFGGCNLRCDYCDEPDTIPLASGEELELGLLRSRILALNGERAHKTISWTGGEPLLHSAALRELMPWARGEGFENYLETNAVLCDRFLGLRRWVDAAAIDLKLPSATARSTWAPHAAFLRAAPKGSFVKVVLTRGSTEAELDRVLALLEANAPSLPLFLQPATPAPSTRQKGRRVEPITPEQAVRFLLKARARLREVRLLPQWHPVWKLR